LAENKENFDGYLEKLALISEAVDDLYDGKKTIVFELKREEFVKMRNLLNGAKENQNEFSIDISGIQFIYLLDE
jgi:hypothetical protein